MSVVGYLLAVASLGTVGVSLTLVGWTTRRRFLAEWSGLPARLAELVVALAVLLIVSGLLGAVGAFRRWPLVLALLGVGAAAWWWRAPRRPPAPPRVPPPDARPDPLAVAAAVGATVLVAGAWLVKTLAALRGGMLQWDTLWYHMPFAARFAQDGWVTRPQFAGDLAHAFLPANAEVVHGIGIVLFGNDVLSPMLNLGWLALALLAAWCIGRPVGAGAATLAAAALVLALPVMVESQGGSAQNDVVGLALVLSALALAVQPGGAGLAIAGAAAGLALGTKLTFVAPVVALTAAVIVAAARGRRRRAALVWCLGVAATGSFWYLRNLVAAGNPLPWYRLGLGPVSLPSLGAEPFDCGTTSVAAYATTPGALRRDLLPDMAVALGPRWPLLLGLMAAGIVTAIAGRRSRPAIMLAAVALLSAVAYLVTPATAGGPAGGCFYYNTRFATPALLLGIAALPLALARTRVPPAWVATAIVAVLVANLPAWNVGNPAARLLIAGVLAVAAGLLAARLRPGSRPWRPEGARPLRSVVARPALVAAAAAVIAVGWPVQAHYLRHRYSSAGPPELDGAAYRAVRDVTGARIAVAGFYTQYPLYGADLSNRVEYPAQRAAWGRFRPPTSCSAWRHALRRGRYDLVVTAAGGYGGPEPVQASWTRGDPAATELVHQGESSVFRIDAERARRLAIPKCGG
jgi:hypothetical protein